MNSPCSFHRCRAGTGGVLMYRGRASLSNLQVQFSAGTTRAHCASRRQCPPTRVAIMRLSTGFHRNWVKEFTQLQ